MQYEFSLSSLVGVMEKAALRKRKIREAERSVERSEKKAPDTAPDMGSRSNSGMSLSGSTFPAQQQSMSNLIGGFDNSNTGQWDNCGG